jgi:Domain of unknown function (DUF4124)
MALTAVTTLACLATTVYRWTDANGVVHFSDQPGPGAEKVPIGPTKLYGTPKPVTQQQPKKNTPEAPKKAQLLHLGYTSLAVTSPAAEQTFFDEPIPVALSLSPELREGHALTWSLNGAPLEQNAGTFTINYLDRGSYSIQATITDSGTQESASTAPVTFYVRQPSLLSPQRPKK